ncbi:MAG: WXG100 family type VII secretion target [Anaerolineales bacterium]|nr:WXG100 family type VII secretion target [Anaerolineales bacterium]
MPVYKSPRIIRRIIRVHPPEADAVARVFGESRSAAENDQAALREISRSLDSEWEGKQKEKFLEDLRQTAGRLANILLPGLRSLEKKYREFTVEKTIEESVEG